MPILMYHAVNSPRSLLSIEPENFRFQMEWLSAQGYKTASLTKLKQYHDNNVNIPDKTIILTFDDGFESLYYNAWPVLAELGFTATVFLVTDYCGKYNDWNDGTTAIPRQQLLNWEQIREMDRQGVEFGSHTLTHPRLDRLDDRSMEQEIQRSREEIEQRLNHPVVSFAYPYGWYDSRVKSIVNKYYETACSTRLGMVTQTSNLYELERVEMYYLRAPQVFKMISSKYISAYLLFRKIIHQAGSITMHRQWR